jgi:hypothetical protein
MRPGVRVLVWTVLAIPAMTGFPLDRFSQEIVSGADAAWILYGLVCQGMIRWMIGIERLRWILALAVWVTLPVVFGGAAISALMHPSSLLDIESMARRGSHYLSLCITMLTVVPLAVGMVAIIPFGNIERRIFGDPSGIRLRDVRILMFLRVFTHILYQVIPTVLEGIREEGVFSRGIPSRQPIGRIRRIRRWIGYLRHVCIEAICSSLMYIPLWAVELSELDEPSDIRKTEPESESASAGPR